MEAPTPSPQSPSRPAVLWTLSALIGFVFIPAFLSITGLLAQQPGTEDRAAASFPSIADDPLNKATWLGVDAWLRDRVPLRGSLLELEGELADRFDDRSTTQAGRQGPILFGDEGWLFVDQSVEPPCFTAQQIESWRDQLRVAHSIVESTGRELWIAIAPDRATVVPHRLGAVDASCQFANRELLRDLIATEPFVIDLAPSLSDEGDVFQTDAHWSPEGALKAAEAIVEAISPGLWTDPVIDRFPALRMGELERQLGARNPEEAIVVNIIEPATSTIDQIETEVDSFRVVAAHTDGAAPLRVIAIHDSFGGSGILEKQVPDSDRWARGAARFLRPWFSDVANLRLEVDSSELVARDPGRSALLDSEVVVGIFVQRELDRRLADYGLVASLIAALASELEAEPAPIEQAGSSRMFTPAADHALVLQASRAADLKISVEGGDVVQRINGTDAVVVIVESGADVVVNGSVERAFLVRIEH